MDAEARRITAVAAHCRRTGRCPVLVHALGTGESFVIEPLADGFRDASTGWVVRPGPDGFEVDGRNRIELRFTDDIVFESYDPVTSERLTGRAGGGASVTLYDDRRADYFQYAISYRADGAISQPG